ncbi:CBF-domain-containing protein [Phellopilus nigrolimitatus]|nr:CBF-domain-containing protein [Phellopilus nigrolimitatus]
MARLHPAKKNALASSKPKQNPADGKQQKNNYAGKGKQEILKGKGRGPAKPNAELADSFKKDILALGGDEEDYELIKDVDSDGYEQTASSSKQDVALSKELAKFTKSLNFSSVKPQDLEDDEEEDAEDSDEEEDEEDSGEEGEETSEATSDEVEEKMERKEEKKPPITIPKVGPSSSLVLIHISAARSHTALVFYPPLPPSSSKSPAPPSPQTLSTQQARAASLHSSELSAYETATSANKLTASSSDAAFLQRVLSSGTLSDRLSALTLMAQSSPVHNTRALETLRGMGQKKGREESLKALRAIVDWWIGGGAPDRKLKYFIDQPLSHPGVTDKHLLVWFFEDWLKKYFYSILQILETLSLDPLPYVRLQTMSLIFTLLREKSEQEQNLLRLLVNKLGDSERPVASRASYHLLQLLQAHPQMKAIVVREMTSLVLRPIRSGVTTSTSSSATHLKFSDDAPKARSKPQEKVEKKDLQQEHAKYYATITLNQIMLAPTEADRGVAVQLVSLYFELFKEILAWQAMRAMASTTRVLGKKKGRNGRTETGKGKSKEGHDGGFAEVEDSDSRLISAILTGVNRALPFAKLGLEDVERSVLIMQICQSLASLPSQSSSSASLSASIADRYYRTLYTSLLDSRLNSSSKQAMYLNLLLKSMKMDTKKERVKAFVRRFVQLLVGAGNGGVEFIAGGLFLLGELFQSEADLRDLLGKPSKKTAATETADNEYDPKKRDPQYAHAGASPMWELIPLLSHYHPTVRLHTSQLLAGKELTANADLSLNTLSHFLDRFVYKNPKKQVKPKGSSAMQPGASAPDGTSLRVVKGAQADGSGTMNEEAFWRKNVKDVPADQLFFHKYFSKKSEKERAKADKVAKRKGGAGDSDEEEDVDIPGDDKAKEDKEISMSDDEEDSEGEEAEIWNAIKATNPDLRGDEGSDISEDEEASMDSDDDDAAASDDAATQHDEDDEDDEDEDDLSLAEGSDADELVDLDAEVPGGLIEYDSAASGEDDGADAEWGGFGGGDSKKRKRGAKQGGEDTKQKKKKLRALPTFATYEDYAKLIEDEPEDDI